MIWPQFLWALVAIVVGSAVELVAIIVAVPWDWFPLVPIESPCHSSGLGCEVGGSGVEGGSTKKCVCELQDSVCAEL